MKTVEKTLVLAKTDVLERGILGRILQKLEDTGLKIVAAKLVQANETMAKGHYTGSAEWKKRIGQKAIAEFEENNVDIEKHFKTKDPEKIGDQIYKWSINYIIKNPVLAMVIEGPHAIERVNAMAGHTEPKKAGRGTIRGDFCVDSILLANLEKRAIYNLLHSSRTEKDAKREIKVWFKPTEIVSYKNNYEKILN
jgi:nucleoside-diphosphate kinase